MARGRIRRLVADRGFGFIASPDLGSDVFFHLSAVHGIDFADLCAGDAVEFSWRQGERGPQATRVERVQGAPPGPQVAPAGGPAPDAPGEGPRAEGYRFRNPYNFVRYLGAPREDAGALMGRCAPPPRDRFLGLSGEIACELEVKTPLFISDSEAIEGDEHKSYRFFTYDGQPAIPGSSLRGMLRGVFEAATNSCFAVLADRTLSFRLGANESRDLVPARVERDGEGRLRLRLLPGMVPPQSIGQKPPSQYAAWVRRYTPLRQGRGVPGTTPYAKRPFSRAGEHGRRCYARLQQYTHPHADPKREFAFFSVEEDLREDDPRDGQEWIPGWLCVTQQNTENKHDERFFFAKPGTPELFSSALEDAVLRAYSLLLKDYRDRHADAVQERRDRGLDPSSPDMDQDPRKRRPAYSRHILEQVGELREGDLVYAKVKQSEAGYDVDHVVPVSVPRLAYRRSIAQLLPAHLHRCKRYDALCPACRVFGWVRAEGGDASPEDLERVAYAGRVVVGAAAPIGGLERLETTPLAILSGPKPTTALFYLRSSVGSGSEEVPPRPGDYDNEQNQLRGRKLYLRHEAAERAEYRRAGERRDGQNRTVRDAVVQGRFCFTARFENLAAAELGALLWSLELDGKGWHRLGYGRPLGFGGVEVTVKSLRVMSPRQRYASLDEGGWREVQRSAWRKWVEEFQSAMVSMYGSSFDELCNIRDLRALLGGSPAKLPIHYPRPSEQPDADAKNFEWFQENKRHRSLALPGTSDEKGLPILRKT